MVETATEPSVGGSGVDVPLLSPYPVAGRIASGIRRLPPGPLGNALRRLTPIQRAVAVAEILGPPVARRRPGDELGPVTPKPVRPRRRRPYSTSTSHTDPSSGS